MLSFSSFPPPPSLAVGLPYSRGTPPRTRYPHRISSKSPTFGVYHSVLCLYRYNPLRIAFLQTVLLHVDKSAVVGSRYTDRMHESCSLFTPTRGLVYRVLCAQSKQEGGGQGDTRTFPYRPARSTRTLVVEFLGRQFVRVSRPYTRTYTRVRGRERAREREGYHTLRHRRWKAISSAIRRRIRLREREPGSGRTNKLSPSARMVRAPHYTVFPLGTLQSGLHALDRSTSAAPRIRSPRAIAEPRGSAVELINDAAASWFRASKRNDRPERLSNTTLRSHRQRVC